VEWKPEEDRKRKERADGQYEEKLRMTLRGDKRGGVSTGRSPTDVKDSLEREKLDGDEKRGKVSETWCGPRVRKD